MVALPSQEATNFKGNLNLDDGIFFVNGTPISTSGAISSDVIVQAFSDLPAPVAGIITLVTSTTYKWEALLDGTAENPVVDQIILPDGGSVYSTATASTVGFKSNSSKPAILITNATNTVSFTGPFRVENAGGTGFRSESSQAFIEAIFIINCVTGVESHNNVFMTFTNITPFQCVDGFELTGTNSGITIVGGGPFLCTGKGFILNNSNGDIAIRDTTANTTDDCISIPGTYTKIDIESTSLQTTTATCLDVTGTIVSLIIDKPGFQTVSGIAMDITGATIDSMEINTGFMISLTGSAALKGDAASANITLNSVASGCAFGAPSGSTLVGITKKDLKYDFQTCPGVADSKSIGGFYLETPITTAIAVQNDWYDLAGETLPVSTLERWSHTSGALQVGAVLEYIDTETVAKTAIAAFSVVRTSGGSNRVYEFALWRDRGSGFVELPESTRRVDIGAAETDVSLLAAEEVLAGDKFKVRVRNTATTDDIQATSGTLIVNT